MLTDTQILVGAYRVPDYDDDIRYPIQVHDDVLGPLWLYREVEGLRGIVRTLTLQDAYEICQDEFMTRVPEDEVIEAYGFYVIFDVIWKAMRDEGELLAEFNTREEAEKCCLDTIQREECDLIEGYEYQPNPTGTGIVSYDLYGQDLSLLTQELADTLGIRLQVEEG